MYLNVQLVSNYLCKFWATTKLSVTKQTRARTHTQGKERMVLMLENI